MADPERTEAVSTFWKWKLSVQQLWGIIIILHSFIRKYYLLSMLSRVINKCVNGQWSSFFNTIINTHQQQHFALSNLFLQKIYKHFINIVSFFLTTFLTVKQTIEGLDHVNLKHIKCSQPSHWSRSFLMLNPRDKRTIFLIGKWSKWKMKAAN